MVNNSDVKVDTVLKLHIMISLNEGSKHGYELMKLLEQSLSKKISAANIYPFLKELKQKKYVIYKQTGREKIYTLTPSGKKFVDNTLLKFHEIIKKSIEHKLTKCYHCGCLVYDNKYSEKMAGKKRSFCCCHCAESYKDYKEGLKHGTHSH
jgi:DNA-binding PadR family transcriptional regulator